MMQQAGISQGGMPSELCAVDIQIKTSAQLQQEQQFESNVANVRNHLKVNQDNIEEEDEYDDEDYLDEEDDGGHDGLSNDHLIKPIGKQPIEVTMQAVGLGDLSAIDYDATNENLGT